MPNLQLQVVFCYCRTLLAEHVHGFYQVKTSFSPSEILETVGHLTHALLEMGYHHFTCSLYCPNMCEMLS